MYERISVRCSMYWYIIRCPNAVFDFISEAKTVSRFKENVLLVSAEFKNSTSVLFIEMGCWDIVTYNTGLKYL